jgi:hypothetical protein
MLAQALPVLIESSAFVLLKRRDNRATLGRFPVSPGRACPANHAIVTTSGRPPVSEFLIVGWHHGSLSQFGYYVGGFELAAIRPAPERTGSFLVRILLYLDSIAGKFRDGASGGRDRTADGDKNE